MSRLLLELEEGHGSVGGQQDVHAVRLDASAVALDSRFILPLFEISVPLKDTFRKRHHVRKPFQRNAVMIPSQQF